jgi:heme exporter protein D
MYYNIEKTYKKNNPNRKFDRFYWITSHILLIIFIGILLFGINIWLLLVIFIIVLVLLVIVYTILDSKQYLKNEKNVKGIRKKIKLYVEYIDDKNISNLVEILKENNITTMDGLDKCILHYQKKCSNKLKNSFCGNLTSLIIALASFMVVGYDEKTKTIDYDKLTLALQSAIGIIILAYALLYILKEIIDGFLGPKDKLYDELEDNLTYIYINFDKYFKGNICNRKKLYGKI